MEQDNDPSGVFTSMGRAADESLEIASAIRAGRLTRRQFEDWYERRKGEGQKIVLQLRERTSDMMKPVGSAMTMTEELMRAVAPSAEARRHVRRRRSVRRAHKSKAK